MLSENYIEKILDYALSCKADYAEVFFEDTKKLQLNILGREVTKCISAKECGIGIRIIKGLTSEYLYSSDIREEAVLRMLKEQWKTETVSGPKNRLCKVTPQKISSVRPLQNIDLKKRVEILKNASAAGIDSYKEITQGHINYIEREQWVQIANTEGTLAEEKRLGARARISMFAGDTNRQTAFSGPGASMGADFLEKTDLEKYAKNTAENARRMLGAQTCPVGVMPVIIAGGFGGLFFHEACGHSLEGSSVADGCSEFAYKIGEKVASDKVTLIDDGTISGEWGSLGIDDEGVPTRKNILIQNGILKGYLLDRLSAKKMHMEPTGSARRENYRFCPTSRMTNTYIESGQDRFEDMIRPIDKGLFVKDINAGSVDPVTGEFNFNTGETYLIEHGEITVPLTSATLIGTGLDILTKVDMVSDDFSLEQGYCYAASGQLPIGAGQPAVRITQMTVGGKKL